MKRNIELKHGRISSKKTGRPKEDYTTYDEISDDDYITIADRETLNQRMQIEEDLNPKDRAREEVRNYAI